MCFKSRIDRFTLILICEGCCVHVLFSQSSDNQSQCLAVPQTPLLNYKYRLDEFKKLFKELPETERLIGGE